MFDWDSLDNEKEQGSPEKEQGSPDSEKERGGGGAAHSLPGVVPRLPINEGNDDVSATQAEKDVRWTVVHVGAVNVRESKSLQSKALGSKEPGEEVRGREDDGWLELLDEPGYMKLSSDFWPILMRTYEGGAHYRRIVATEIFDLLESELAAAKRPAPLGLGPELVMAAETAAGAPSRGEVTHAAVQEGEEVMTVNFVEEESAEVEAARSAAVREWHRTARLWLQRLDPRAKVPPSTRLPQSAVNWEPAAAVMFALTHGQFDPVRDVPELDARTALRTDGLVSVCCATSDRRRSFHPLLYENFVKQTHEPRELVIVHTGELPSDFFMEKAQTDARVVYRFFPVTREAPGSPRLSDEKMGNPWDSVLVDDVPEELTHWGPGDPWTYEITRDGWTKGLKRNVACCIARGTTMAHFEDGCLYASDYLSRMLDECHKGAPAAVPGTMPPAAVALSKWYTLSISELDFRYVDMKKPEPLWEHYGMDRRKSQEEDHFNHGFVYVYTRSAWQQQPFPDYETAGTTDADFMKELKKQGVPVKLVEPFAPEALAACGWHRDATCGAKDAPANINHSQVVTFMMYRGEDSKKPNVFGNLLRLVKEVASDLLTRRERYLRDLVEEHGSVYVCSFCNFAVSLAKNAKDNGRTLTANKPVIDGYDMTQTWDKFQQKFDALEISAAGGAVAEGHWEPTPSSASWLSGVSQRMAICRNCGFQLGWRYEPADLPRECVTLGCAMMAKHPSSHCCKDCRTKGACNHSDDCEKKETPLPHGPVKWAMIWRHLRERRRQGESVPVETEHPRHKDTQHNAGRNDVCPEGHRLRCFCTGQGNGGALPCYYTCDICDQNARGLQHMWGCGTCDYDMCERCKMRRR